jgi:hypothetical protein
MFPCSFVAPSPAVQMRQGGCCLRPLSSVFLLMVLLSFFPRFFPRKKRSVGTRVVGGIAATPHAGNVQTDTCIHECVQAKTYIRAYAHMYGQENALVA